MDDPQQAILGTGWSFPPTFSRLDFSVVMASGIEDVRQSLWVLFSTMLGERVMLPDYGTQIWQMVFSSINTTLLTQLADMVSQAILYWEPRIDVVDISVTPDASDAGRVLIMVDYVVRRTNARSNLVYPFYLQEMTLPVQEP
jgi:phage baseplate assembly protein W